MSNKFCPLNIQQASVCPHSPGKLDHFWIQKSVSTLILPRKLCWGDNIKGNSRTKFCRLTIWAWLHMELFTDSCFWIAAHIGKPWKGKVASSPLVCFFSLATSRCFKGVVLQPLCPAQHCKKISLRPSHLLKPYTSTCQFAKSCGSPERAQG